MNDNVSDELIREAIENIMEVFHVIYVKHRAKKVRDEKRTSGRFEPELCIENELK